MKELISNANKRLEGIRGILTILGTWGLMYIDTVTSQLTGVTPEAFKAALIGSAPITAKLIWTDLRPKIVEIMKTRKYSQ